MTAHTSPSMSAIELPDELLHLAQPAGGRDPIEQQALLVMSLLDRLGVMDPEATGALADARPLAALVLAGFDSLLARRAGADSVPPAEPTREERYASLVTRVRHLLHVHLPDEAHVAVVSRGDRALVEVEGRTATHFPQDERGGWAGHYPVDGHAAAAHLDELRRRGVSHLAIPATGRWWLDHYVELTEHLTTVGRTVVDDEDLVLFQLQPVPAAGPAPAAVCPPLGALLHAMLPRGASVVLAANDPAFVVDQLVPNQWTACSQHDDDGVVTASVVQAATHRPDHEVVVVLVHTGTWWSASHPRLWADLQRGHHLLADRTGLATVFELVPPGTTPRRPSTHDAIHVAHLAHSSLAHSPLAHPDPAPRAVGGPSR